MHLPCRSARKPNRICAQVAPGQPPPQEPSQHCTASIAEQRTRLDGETRCRRLRPRTGQA
eukprot:9467256-Pyramimonas_sp.AAC.1